MGSCSLKLKPYTEARAGCAAHRHDLLRLCSSLACVSEGSKLFVSGLGLARGPVACGSRVYVAVWAYRFGAWGSRVGIEGGERCVVLGVIEELACRYNLGPGMLL